MKKLILLACAVFLLSLEIGSDARRYKNRVQRIRDRDRDRLRDDRDRLRDDREREHRRDGEEQLDQYTTYVDDAIIIRVPRKYRQRDNFETAADDDTRRRTYYRNGTTYQQWPGDFQIQQIHYPTNSQFPIYPQQVPQYPWGTVPQQIHQYPTHPPRLLQPQYPTHPPRLQPQYPTHPPQQQPQYPTHPPQDSRTHPPQQQPQNPTHPPQDSPTHPTHPPLPTHPPRDSPVHPTHPPLPTHPPPRELPERTKPPPTGGDPAIVTKPPHKPPSNDRPASCGKSYVYSEDNTRIVDGAPAAHGEFPFLVALMIRGGKTQMCGGSLIDDRTVLTAAHCFDGASASDLSDLQVVLGDHNLYHEGEPSVTKRHIEKLITHRSWNKRSNFNDIAMLKLASPVEFNQYVQPICLSRSSKSYAPGKAATVAGWGRTSPADGTHQVPQQTPLKITIPLVDNPSCQKAFYRVQIAEHMICAGEGRKSACLGDSGGPFMIKSDGGGGQSWEQIGIVSWGYNCVGLSVYTRVNDFKDWIEKWRNS